jgi:hypothetical protein
VDCAVWVVGALCVELWAWPAPPAPEGPPDAVCVCALFCAVELTFPAVLVAELVFFWSVFPAPVAMFVGVCVAVAVAPAF